MQRTDSVAMLKTVGVQRLKQLHALGIDTVEDLMTYFPRDYEDRREEKGIAELTAGQSNTFVAKVLAAPEVFHYQKKTVIRARVGDEDGQVTCVWFGMTYLKNSLKVGEDYLFTGRYEVKYGKKQVLSPSFEMASKKDPLASGHILPIYPATHGLSQKILRKLIYQALEETKNQFPDLLPKKIREQYHLCEKNYALQNIHFPEDEEGFLLARQRLVFEELYLLQLALFSMKEETMKGRSGIRLSPQPVRQEAEAQMPFSLTQAQRKVLGQIEEDFVSGRVMNRLVQGDVGSGKTAVAMIVSYEAIQNGYQAALMAPTEVLASQHAKTFSEVLGPLGVRVGFLRGTMKKREKEALLAGIASGEVDMIIGTHAVIQSGVAFSALALVITDEQHRSGVKQRVRLSQKGQDPHVLVITATPIPRTLALILYGDLDISVMDALPTGRQQVDTLVVTSAYHERVYGFLKRQMDAGRQVYVVCPSVEESEKRQTESVMQYGTYLAQEVFAAYRVGLLHGKMKPAQKEEIMVAFARGEIQMLVATTVIEVGVNVPNATVMVVENAEYFGLSQLHQLRGRVGRGTEKSYCVLISDAKNPEAKERLKTMKATSDGFRIAEMDLHLRGPGDFFGTRQHGLPPLKIANLYRDMEILTQAQQAARQTLQHKDELSKEQWQALEQWQKTAFTATDVGI